MQDRRSRKPTGEFWRGSRPSSSPTVSTEEGIWTEGDDGRNAGRMGPRQTMKIASSPPSLYAAPPLPRLKIPRNAAEMETECGEGEGEPEKRGEHVRRQLASNSNQPLPLSCLFFVSFSLPVYNKWDVPGNISLTGSQMSPCLTLLGCKQENSTACTFILVRTSTSYDYYTSVLHSPLLCLFLLIQPLAAVFLLSLSCSSKTSQDSRR